MRSLFLHYYSLRLKVLETRGPGEKSRLQTGYYYFSCPFLSVNYTNTNFVYIYARARLCVYRVIAVWLIFIYIRIDNGSGSKQNNIRFAVPSSARYKPSDRITSHGVPIPSCSGRLQLPARIRTEVRKHGTAKTGSWTLVSLQSRARHTSMHDSGYSSSVPR